MSDRTCSLADCQDQHEARGYCKRHYWRLCNYGDPLAGPPPRERRRPNGSTPPPCVVDSCDEPAMCKKLCTRHYQRKRATGSPTGHKPRTPRPGQVGARGPRVDPALRFWPHVDKSGPLPDERPELGPCWVWTGSAEKRGYGRFRLAGPPRINLAHVWSYTDATGPVPAGLELDHLCRRPACVRPSHLEAVTHHVNVLRGDTAKSENLTHCKRRGHPYDLVNTYVNPKGHKVCRKCVVINKRESRQRRRLAGRAVR